MTVVLSDGREVGLPYSRVPSLRWLAGVTATQREDWSIEPGGFAIHWNTLDDGVEVAHLLRLEPIA